jgi:MYXO-CTERM domain-containing protein
VFVTLVLVAAPARAALITVTPSDTSGWLKIEGAKGGDIVELAPGTYKYRVMLQQTGSAASPITIRAQDPKNRPVFDLAGQAVSAWPGSYTAGDKGRGCWQVKGSHYVISGIVFKNCQDSASAGLRAVDCGPLTIRDCLFQSNTNGLTGSSQDLVVEFSELVDNGKLVATGNMTHNIYIYGGVFTLRYSYVHDPHEGQNFHIRARQATLEYNWLARPSAYPGDIMSCNTLCGSTGTNPVTQKMLLRGNVIIQGNAQNLSQVIALYNDEPGGSYDSSGESTAMELTLEYNTVIGTPVAAGKTQRLVNMRNDSGVATHVHLSNNIIVGLASLYELGSTTANNWTFDGKNNWVSTGTTALGALTATIVGASPGFVNAAAKDYTLAASSPCRGKAAPLATPPGKEYYRDEAVKLQYRARLAALDLGAFEHGTATTPVGPYGTPTPTPDAGLPADAGVKKDGAATKKDSAPPKLDGGPAKKDGAVATGDGQAASSDVPAAVADGAGQGDGAAKGDGARRADAGTAGADEGCSCALDGAPRTERAAGMLLLLLALAGLARRRR